jgi:hypothetical protein
MAEQQELKVSAETKTTEDPVASLKAELEKERSGWQEREKLLSKKLTEAQQDASEAARFVKSVLPRLNRLEEAQKAAPRDFVKEWDASPETAISSRVDDKINPVLSQQQMQEHKLARLSLIAKHPDFLELEPRIAEISQKDQQTARWSYTEEGLENLYKIAKGEKLEKFVEEQEKKKESEKEKERAFAESSTGGGADGNNKNRPLSPQERRMMAKLGYFKTEDEYRKWRDIPNPEGGASGED